VKQRLISKGMAVLRVKPDQINELLHPRVDPIAEKGAVCLAKGLPAGPGGAVGRVVFTADDAEEWAKKGEKVILVRNETSPEDVHGMHAAQAILTAKGGMTSHAALVARGWGKCCIVGCSDLQIELAKKEIHVNSRVLREGDYVTLNGSKGNVYEGELNLLSADPWHNPWYKEIMKWADQFRTLNVRTNTDTPHDAKVARSNGAEGIGLCRTEHMFFGPERIKAMRKMILSDTVERGRRHSQSSSPTRRTTFSAFSGLWRAFL